MGCENTHINRVEVLKREGVLFYSASLSIYPPYPVGWGVSQLEVELAVLIGDYAPYSPF
jgi:hypothetical protein